MKYDLKDIATVSGLPGLYKVLNPTRNGVILESVDAEKKRMMTQTRHKLSLLQEISIFVTNNENSVSLEGVFAKILEIHGKEIKLDYKKATSDQLYKFIGEVVEDYDKERVYVSDIKKLISWYNIIATNFKPIEEKKKEVKKAAPKKKTSAKKDDSKESDKKPAAKKSAPKKKTTTKKKEAK